MADETNEANAQNASSGTSIDYKAKAEELETANEALTKDNASKDQSHKAVQRALDQARNQAATVASLTAGFDELKQVVEVLAEGDENASERIAAVRQSRSKDSALQEAQNRALKYLSDAGVDSEDDPRYQDVSELWTTGDYQGAIDVARNYRQEMKGQSKEKEMVAQDTDLEAQIEVAVDKRLRAAGIREVDTEAGASNSGVKFTQANLEDQLANMTTEEILANLSEINEAQ